MTKFAFLPHNLPYRKNYGYSKLVHRWLTVPARPSVCTEEEEEEEEEEEQHQALRGAVGAWVELLGRRLRRGEGGGV